MKLLVFVSTLSFLLFAHYNVYGQGAANKTDSSVKPAETAAKAPAQPPSPATKKNDKATNKDKSSSGTSSLPMEVFEVDERSGNTEYTEGQTKIIEGKTVVASDKNERLPRFIYATFHFSFFINGKRRLGKVKVKLHHREMPKTVEHFLGLAEGKTSFTDPKTNTLVQRPFYDGLIIHRVVKDFLIQGGDPTGSGNGRLGLSLVRESNENLKHDRPGVVSMYNSSQFFIVLKPTEHLDKHYNILGQVVKGLSVVNAISQVKTLRSDRPRRRVIIKKIEIDRIY